MTPDQLNAMASNMESLAASDYDIYSRERDLLVEVARYLRQCAEVEPVATVRVHDTGGNAGIAWSGVPTEHAGTMRGGTPLYTHPQPQQAGVPGWWADIVEQRLLTWRQRFTNRSGDQLALDDFMDQQSIDDLVDFVCDEHAAPQPPSAQYPLPDDLYPGSKDWVAADYRGRVEWLHTMYESKKRDADLAWSQVGNQLDAVEALRELVAAHSAQALDAVLNSADQIGAATSWSKRRDKAWRTARAALAAQGGNDE